MVLLPICSCNLKNKRKRGARENSGNSLNHPKKEDNKRILLFLLNYTITIIQLYSKSSMWILPDVYLVFLGFFPIPFLFFFPEPPYLSFTYSHTSPSFPRPYFPPPLYFHFSIVIYIFFLSYTVIGITKQRQSPHLQTQRCQTKNSRRQTNPLKGPVTIYFFQPQSPERAWFNPLSSCLEGRSPANLRSMAGFV